MFYSCSCQRLSTKHHTKISAVYRKKIELYICICILKKFVNVYCELFPHALNNIFQVINKKYG
uniref:Methionyl/Valyl/Leucyl/Isoleucyl-tRNA synthetase anticodon-binding domain-containing protein n=1 Tax=Ascaris lumbricoides TaxID=6252 RepID=A0A0M3I5C0_ASCLU